MLLHWLHIKFFRRRNIDNVIVSVLKIYSVKSVNSSIIHQMLAVETYYMRDTVYRSNRNMAAIVINP